MKYYVVYPVGAEFGITVRAASEARARLTAAIWYLTTSMRAGVDALKVVPAGRLPEPCECVNDEDLEKLERLITDLVNAAYPMRCDT